MTTLRPFTEQEYQEYEMSRLFISERRRKRTSRVPAALALGVLTIVIVVLLVYLL
jgi:hypothetical protein